MTVMIHPKIAKDALVHETRYLRFYLRLQLKKTSVFTVYNRSGMPLGFVRWYGKWRQYCYLPSGDTTYNSDCLQDIMEFIRARMAERQRD